MGLCAPNPEPALLRGTRGLSLPCPGLPRECCSASNFPLFLPKVPVIPVVYSSFTTFYNPKKNLFTSGTKETLQRRGRRHLHVEIWWEGSGAEQEEPCWQMCGGS